MKAVSSEPYDNGDIYIFYKSSEKMYGMVGVRFNYFENMTLCWTFKIMYSLIQSDLNSGYRQVSCCLMNAAVTALCPVVKNLWHLTGCQHNITNKKKNVKTGGYVSPNMLLSHLDGSQLKFKLTFIWAFYRLKCHGYVMACLTSQKCE